MAAVVSPGQRTARLLEGLDDLHGVDVPIGGRFSEDTRTFSLSPSYPALSTTVVPAFQHGGQRRGGDRAALTAVLGDVLGDVREHVGSIPDRSNLTSLALRKGEVKDIGASYILEFRARRQRGA